MSATLRNAYLKSCGFREICLEVIPCCEESHHFGETGYFTFMICSLARYHLAARVYIQHTPSIGCNLGSLYIMFNLSYRL